MQELDSIEDESFSTSLDEITLQKKALVPHRKRDRNEDEDSESVVHDKNEINYNKKQETFVLHKVDELPQWQRDNQYITSGYRYLSFGEQ